MDSLLPCKGCTRPRGDIGTQMETPPHSKPFKAKTFSLVTLLLCLPLVEGNVSPHHPVNMTLLVYSPETGGPLNSSSNVAPKGTGWPELTFDLCILGADGFGHGPHQLQDFFTHGSYGLFTCNCNGEGPHSYENVPVYVCPREGRDRNQIEKCGDLIPFTAPPGDVKLQEQSIGSAIPSRTSFK